MNSHQTDGQTPHRTADGVQQSAQTVAGKRFRHLHGGREGEAGERVGEDDTLLFESAKEAEQNVVDASSTMSLPASENNLHVLSGDLPQVQALLCPFGQDGKNHVEVPANASEVGWRMPTAALPATDHNPCPKLLGHRIGESLEFVLDGLVVPGIRPGCVQTCQRGADCRGAVMVGIEQAAPVQEEHEPVKGSLRLQDGERPHATLGKRPVAAERQEAVQHVDGVRVVLLPTGKGGKAGRELSQQITRLGKEYG
ncbi:hypothetical protein [Streptomyces sp. NPDC047869]|uniref:hypothetical protein n=1 Tax=Streptomyces sp. NPDC047869 TaxID=3154709 RepID=UPI00345321F8